MDRGEVGDCGMADSRRLISLAFWPESTNSASEGWGANPTSFFGGSGTWDWGLLGLVGGLALVWVWSWSWFRGDVSRGVIPTVLRRM